MICGCQNLQVTAADRRRHALGPAPDGLPRAGEFRRHHVSDPAKFALQLDDFREVRARITFSVVQRFVDDIVALPDRDIFDAMIWVMERCKLVVKGAAAPRVAVELSGGNVNLDQLRGLSWN